MEIKPLVECVPNVSAGADIAQVEALAEAVSSVSEVLLLYVDVGKNANRTVFTYVGEPSAIKEASFRLVRKASEIIDMSQHRGVHPRIGAVDVMPFIPLQGIGMPECIALSKVLGKRIADELGLPGFFYGKSANSAEAARRTKLEDIRRGEYEELAEKLMQADWRPDFGPREFNAHFGAMVIGARELLVAFNVDLDCQDLGIAKWIAARLRGSGYLSREDGKLVQKAGRFPSVKAIGWEIESFGNVQVSMNLTNYRQDSLAAVYAACNELALAKGVGVLGSELIGLCPFDALAEDGEVEATIEKLGLGHREPFVKEQRIIELAIDEAQRGAAPRWRIN